MEMWLLTELCDENSILPVEVIICSVKIFSPNLDLKVVNEKIQTCKSNFTISLPPLPEQEAVHRVEAQEF